MKTIIAKIAIAYHSLLKVTTCIIALLFIVFKTDAQETKYVESIIKGIKGEYQCSKSLGNKRTIYSNIYNDLSKVQKEYPLYIDVDPSFIGYRIKIHDQFIKSAKNSFTVKKLKELAERKEIFEVTFVLDQDGKQLSYWFVLDSNTLVTPDELFALEQNFKANVIFTPIRRSEVRFFDEVNIETTFYEVCQGEVPWIKRQEKYQDEREQIHSITE